ncbi:YvaK [Bacillus sp. B14905]|nr:YvaK [Bacillus sp. B14905]
MKLTKPQPLTIEGGKKAVLLLHGFTGSTKDVKKLGGFYLNEVIPFMHRFIVVTE